MEIDRWLLLLSLGAVLGVVGQILRVVVGLKKLYEEDPAKDGKLPESFSGPRLFLSLAIGAAAGTLGVIASQSLQDATKLSSEMLLPIIAIGYSGADFIEGFMAKHLPGGSAAKPQAPDQTPTETNLEPDPAVG